MSNTDDPYPSIGDRPEVGEAYSDIAILLAKHIHTEGMTYPEVYHIWKEVSRDLYKAK